VEDLSTSGLYHQQQRLHSYTVALKNGAQLVTTATPHSTLKSYTHSPLPLPLTPFPHPSSPSTCMSTCISAVAASVPQVDTPSTPESDGRTVLVSILQDVIEKSGLIGLLDSHLRNESLVDIDNHSDLYYLIFQVNNRNSSSIRNIYEPRLCKL
jgi:hypothetical protein